MKKVSYLLIPLCLWTAACDAKKQAEAAPSEPASTPAVTFPKGSPAFSLDSTQALEQAKAENKPAILVFSATWCGPCQSMKKTVYPSKEITPLHDKFVWAYLDVDEEANAKIAQKYRVESIPHIQFVSANGKDLGSVIGASSPREFAVVLQQILAKASNAKAPTATVKSIPASEDATSPKAEPSTATPAIEEQPPIAKPAREENKPQLPTPAVQSQSPPTNPPTSEASPSQPDAVTPVPASGEAKAP